MFRPDAKPNSTAIVIVTAIFVQSGFSCWSKVMSGGRQLLSGH